MKNRWYKRPTTLLWFFSTLLSLGLLAPSFIASLKLLKQKLLIYALNLVGVVLFVSLPEPTLGFILIIATLTLSLILKKQNLHVASRVEQSPQESESLGQALDTKEASQFEQIQSPAIEEFESVAEESFFQEAHENSLTVDDIAEFNKRNTAKSSEPEIIEEVTEESSQVYDESIQPLEKMNLNQWLSFIFKIRPNVKKVRQSFHYHSSLNESMQQARREFVELVEGFNFDSLKQEFEINIQEIYGCGLIEVRKGARVTHRESTYSGSYGGGSVRIGAFSVGGGRSGGSSSSTSISYPAPDELTLIDEGKFIVSSLKVSLVGSMFTKSTEFKKMVDFQTNGRQILIAPKTGSKVWIAEFPRLADTWVAGSLLEAAYQCPQKRLDLKSTSEYGTIADVVRSNFNRALAEIDLAIENLESELKTFREVMEEYQRRYPKKVKGLEAN